jgi:type IV secretory pathway TraG/TraD family ATPase VirD4
MLGVGRGRKVAVVLAYQNLGQVYAHYGRDGGDAVLGSINTMVFLPGLDQRTTEFAARRVGRTTVLQHTTVDATGTQNDAERLAETKRDLIDAAELRQLVRHKQAVAIIDTAPPIKFTYPPFVQAAREALSRPVHKGTAEVIDFRTAERKKKDLSSERSVNLVDSEQRSSANSEKVEQLKRSPSNEDDGDQRHQSSRPSPLGQTSAE